MERDPKRERTIRERIGGVIAARAVIRGIDPDALARAAGIDDRQMKRALRGESGFSFYSLERVATVLGWTLGELMFVAFPPNGDAVRGPRRRSPQHASKPSQ